MLLELKEEITQAPTLVKCRNKLIQTLSTSAVGRVIEELRAGQNIQIRPIEDIGATPYQEKNKVRRSSISISPLAPDSFPKMPELLASN